MRRLFFACLLLVSPMTALSEPIVVRSGEHPTFTRLVLALPEGTEWRLEREVGQAKLILDGFGDGFNLDRTFEVIPRSRLSALLAQTATLELQLACDCPVNAFLEGNGYLVLDISDGPILEPRPETPVARSSLPTSGFAFGELLWRSSPEHELAPVPGLARVEEGVSEIESEVSRDEADLALETQSRLLEAFSEAASRGLLDLKDDVLDPLQNELPPAPEPIFDSSAVEEPVSLAGKGNIRVTTSKDVPSPGEPEDLALSGDSCPDPRLVAIPTWGTEDPLNVQLAASNARLFDELGRIDPKYIVSQAKLYLYFGFGAEARQTLQLVPGLAREHPELMDLASIMEYGFARNPRSLHRFADCESDFALWAVLAAKDVPVNRAIDAEAALRAFQSLPQHLKFFLGPALSERLLERGDIANASIVLRSVDRLEENEFDQPRIADAKASSLRGDDDGATVVLDEIISADTPEAPAALADRIDQHVRDDTPVPADVALLAESYAFELRLSEDGQRMFRAFVLAATKSGQFSKAMDALAKSEQEPETKAELASYLVRELANHASDPEFLKLHFESFRKLGDVVSPEARIGTAERLFELGFLDRAAALLTEVPARYTSDSLRILNAKIALASGDYQASLGELAGMNSIAASQLRAENLQRLGENQVAARLFAASGQPERETASLWLTEDWAETISADTPVFGPLAVLANQNMPVLTPDETMLARSEDALTASAAVRDTLRTALDALRVSE